LTPVRFTRASITTQAERTVELDDSHEAKRSSTMSDVIASPSHRGDVVDPLMGQARERQRRRRLRLTGAVVVAALVTGILFVASREWGFPLARWHTTNGDLIRQDVRTTVVKFDNALVDGDYARACSLLDVTGKSVLRRATHAAGIGGNCEARLAAVARLVGPRNLDELKAARIYAIQYAGSANRGFAAGLWFDQLDITWAGSVPSVGLSKNDKHSPVLIQCPPFICGLHSLQNYIAQAPKH